MQPNISASCYVDTPSFTYNRFFFDFEKNFDHWGTYYWFMNNWKLSLYFVGIYLVLIFSSQHLMKTRSPFRLRKLLFLWNVILALFHVLVIVRSLPIYIDRQLEYGFYASICYPGAAEHKQAAIWAYWFALFKVVELGDTVFIVLMKKPLLVVHWYHHASVLIYGWGSSRFPSGMHPYFALANAGVHACMYSYLALKVIKVPMPKATPMLVTTLELIQLAFGVFVNIYGYFAKVGNKDCCIFDQAILISALLYVSYLLLFTNFFIKSYISKKPLLEIMGVKEKKTS